MDKIQKAIVKDELPAFLIGKIEYKCSGRSDFDEPTDYLFCWESEIIPFTQSNPEKFKTVFLDALHKLLLYENDKILGIYSVAKHVFWCSYFIEKGKIKLDIDLKDITTQLAQIVKREKDNLIKDKRWAGAEWNSKQGLFEPINRLLLKLPNHE